MESHGGRENRPFASLISMWHTELMTRENIITRLRAQAPAIKAQGASALYIFGSYARNEASEESDVDVFIEYADKDGKPFNIFDLSRIQLIIEDALDKPVDVLTRDSLENIKLPAEQDAIRIF